jgi:tetratricopeptide (TPR) repeat protein
VSKGVKVSLIIVGTIMLLIIAFLVWGRTLRMAYANYLFKHDKNSEAVKIYEDMAVDQPKSPYTLHNRALGYYKQGNYQRSSAELENANKALEDSKVNSKEFINRFQYHLGNAFFKLGSKPGSGAQSGPEGNNSDPYSQAVQSYKKALEANPKDKDAKYNYELALLHMKQPKSERQQPKPNPSPKPNEDLLNANKQDEKYLPLVPISEKPVDKDW